MNKIPDEVIVTFEYAFEDTYNSLKLKGTIINKAILNQCIVSMLLDTKRKIESHNIQGNIDQHKMAGYITMWIVRLKPVQILKPKSSTYYTKRQLLSNIIFGVYAGLSHLKITMET